MAEDYINIDEHGVMRIAGSRVMMDSVVAAFWEGHSAETIRSQYQSLSLEQVYGAIAYYLGHRQEVDEYMRRRDAIWEQKRRENPIPNSAVIARLCAMREVGSLGQP